MFFLKDPHKEKSLIFLIYTNSGVRFVFSIPIMSASSLSNRIKPFALINLTKYKKSISLTIYNVDNFVDIW